eukprot:748648-Hanusia_phi.AAC.3
MKTKRRIDKYRDDALAVFACPVLLFVHATRGLLSILLNSYGSQTPSARDDKRGRVILASGLVAFTLIVLALVAAASASGFGKPARPSMALQMLAIRQLQLSILTQSPVLSAARMETMVRIRKMLDRSEFGNFDLEDKMVEKPTSNSHITAQTSLHLLASKARPLEGGKHSIDLVPLTSAPNETRSPRSNLLVDSMGDRMVQASTASSHP